MASGGPGGVATGGAGGVAAAGAGGASESEEESVAVSSSFCMSYGGGSSTLLISVSGARPKEPVPCTLGGRLAKDRLGT